MRSRKEIRMRLDASVLLRVNDREWKVEITNFSPNGIRFRSRLNLPLYREIQFEMDISGQKFDLKGTIRWSNPVHAKGGGEEWEIGLAFLEPPVEFLRFLGEFPLEKKL